MSEMRSALRDVLRWSKGRPAWQRDALRRLYLAGRLSAEDEEDLYGIAKAARALGDGTSGSRQAQPLADEHLPAPPTPGEVVTLEAIRDVQDVNALEPCQSLVFGRFGLTVIYGDNAVGKSGYGRILRKVCRARGGDRRVLPNVFTRQPSDDRLRRSHIAWEIVRRR